MLDTVVVTRPRSDVTAIRGFTSAEAMKRVVTRPRSDVTAIFALLTTY